MDVRTLDRLPADADVYAAVRLAVMPQPHRIWASDDGSLLWLGKDWEEGGLVTSAVGPSAQELVRHVLTAEPDMPRTLELPRPTSLVAVGWQADWDFRWTTTAPPPPTRVVSWLETEAELAEVRTLQAHSAPLAAAHPGDAWAKRWCGARDPEGLLVACAADESDVSPAVGRVEHGLVGGVATHTAARGQGLAADVTSWLTHQLLAEGCATVGLGLYAENDVARRLYTRLGFRDEHRMTSLEVRG